MVRWHPSYLVSIGEFDSLLARWATHCPKLQTMRLVLALSPPQTQQKQVSETSQVCFRVYNHPVHLKACDSILHTSYQVDQHILGEIQHEFAVRDLAKFAARIWHI